MPQITLCCLIRKRFRGTTMTATARVLITQPRHMSTSVVARRFWNAGRVSNSRQSRCGDNFTSNWPPEVQPRWISVSLYITSLSVQNLLTMYMGACRGGRVASDGREVDNLAISDGDSAGSRVVLTLWQEQQVELRLNLSVPRTNGLISTPSSTSGI